MDTAAATPQASNAVSGPFSACLFGMVQSIFLLWTASHGPFGSPVDKEDGAKAAFPGAPQ